MTLNFKRRGGSLNKLINKLPFELHIPTYNYCGPGTKLSKRLSRGDKGVNVLDEACKEHDIAYSRYSDIQNRNKADEVLAKKAIQRFKSSDASLGERIAALGVSGIMKAKSRMGMGIRGKILRKNKKIVVSFPSVVQKVKRGIIGKKYKNLRTAAKYSLSLVKGLKVKQPKRRVIPIPKSGGLLPLLPIFAGLSALGALAGGSAGIAKAVNDARAASKKLEEQQRHNKSMESIMLGKKGSGLYLKPYRTGCGLFLKPKNC